MRFLPSRRQTERLNFTFVRDGLKSGLKQAKAAGDRQVTVIGRAAIAQQLLAGRPTR